MVSSNLMVWVDIETEGLDIQTCGILELGIAISNVDLEILGAQTWLIAKPYDVRANLQEPVLAMHTASGLLDDLEIPKNTKSWDRVQKEAIAFLEYWNIAHGKEPMCGSTVSFDRKFLERSLPQLEAYFYYRNIDVSSLKELAKKFGYKTFPSDPNKAHRPLQDLMNSMAELRFYQETMLR